MNVHVEAAPDHRSAPFALEARGVARDYRSGFLMRRRRVLGPLDVTVASGRAVGLMGPNGSGKSTFLRLAAGVDRPSAGRVRVFDRDPSESTARARTGLVADGFPFPLELTGREVLDAVARLRRVGGGDARERRDRVDAWLERIDLVEHARRTTRRYSTGMRRRLALACALIHEPDLLLLDEPGAGLDARGAEVFAAAIDERLRANAAIVLCSHQGTELFRHCAEIVVLLDGTAAWRGTADALAARAATVDLEVEVAGGAADERARLTERIEADGGARVRAMRPAADATARLFDDLAAERESRP